MDVLNYSIVVTANKMSWETAMTGNPGCCSGVGRGGGGRHMHGWGGGGGIKG